MSKEISLPPKERINITYKPKTGGASEEVDLPLRLLVMGDYTLQEDDRDIEDRKPININKDNFDNVLKSHNLKLDINVQNKLSGDPEDEDNLLGLSLNFESLKDFDPDTIVNKSEQTRQLLELRKVLASLKAPLSSIPKFRKKLQSIITDETKRKQLLQELGIKEGGE